MEHDHLTFPEAIKVLAERYGIPMPERQRFDDPEAQRRAALLEMHEVAADVFQTNLRGSGGKRRNPVSPIRLRVATSPLHELPFAR